jgi:WD40 repeat protein
MRLFRLSLAAGVALLAAPGMARAQGVSFSKEIVPIFKENCIKCHNSRQPQGGLALSSFTTLEKGGKGGKVLAPKAADSRLVKYLEGTLMPKMPIGGTLSKAQIDKIKTWINAGAKPDVDPNLVVIPDSSIPAVKIPVVPLKVPALPEAAALAWSKDGKVLAIGTYKVVRLVNPADGKTLFELKGHADVIHDLQFSRDGKLLAASGGDPAQQGEIKIWDVATGNLVKTITGHNDFIYSCSWGEGDKTIASASYDKLVKIWDVATGAEVKTLKDHADAVYAVAFNPAGNLLASGSADRSVKVWDVATGKRIYTLAGHTDIVLSLAWNAAGNQITSVGADKTIRTWNVNPQAGQAARNVTGHDKTINEVVYSADGTLMATVSDDKSAKIWNAGNGGQMQTIKDLPDSVLSAAFSPDNKLVAIGGYDGSVKIYNVADAKPVSTIIELPKAPEKAGAATDPKGAAGKTDPKAPAAATDSKAAPAKTDPKAPATATDPKAVPAKADPKAPAGGSDPKAAPAKAAPAKPGVKPAPAKAAPAKPAPKAPEAPKK